MADDTPEASSLPDWYGGGGGGSSGGSDGGSSGGGGSGDDDSNDDVIAGEFTGDEVREASRGGRDTTLEDVADTSQSPVDVDKSTEEKKAQKKKKQQQQDQQQETGVTSGQQSSVPAGELTGDEVRAIQEASEDGSIDEERVTEQLLSNEAKTRQERQAEQVIRETQAIAQGRQQARQQAAEGNQFEPSDFETTVDDGQVTATLKEGTDEAEALAELNRTFGRVTQAASQVSPIGTAQARGRTQARRETLRNRSSRDFAVAQASGDTRQRSGDLLTRAFQNAPERGGSGLQTSEEIRGDITSGGFLSRSTERDLQNVSQQFTQGVNFVAEGVGDFAAVSFAPSPALTAVENTQTTEEDPGLQTAVEGVTTTFGQVGNVPGLILLGESGAEAAQGVAANAPQNFDETVGTTATVADEVVVRTGEAAATSVRERPIETLGAVGGGAILSAASGAALGSAARKASRVTRPVRDRVRTVGSTDITDSIPEDVLRQFDPDAEDTGEQFPGIEDEELFREDEAAAIRQQADEQTPDVVEQRFEEASVEEGTDIKKTLDTEPGGPDSGRAAQGIEAPEADSELASAFETSGTSFGPAFSPNFLRLRGMGGESARFSLRPGLPDTGTDRPTGVIARTDVTESRATSTPEFDRELRQRSGDTTARTVSEDFEGFDPIEEAEVQVPPEAQFADLGGSITRNILRRLGIGSDFRIEVGGRRVPVRAVAPEDRIDTGGSRLGRFADDTRGQAQSPDIDLRPAARRLDEFGDRSPPVDRPTPIATPSGSGTSESDVSEATVTNLSDGATSGSQSDEVPAGGSGGSAGGSGRGGSAGGGSVASGSSGRPSGTSSIPGGGSSGGGSGGGSSGFGRGGGSGGGGGSEGGSSGGGGGGGGGSNTPSGGPSVVNIPRTPTQPRKRVKRPDSDTDADKKEDESLLFGADNPNLTDFLNPITGEVLKTDAGSVRDRDDGPGVPDFTRIR